MGTVGPEGLPPAKVLLHFPVSKKLSLPQKPYKLHLLLQSQKIHYARFLKSGLPDLLIALPFDLTPFEQ